MGVEEGLAPAFIHRRVLFADASFVLLLASHAGGCKRFPPHLCVKTSACALFGSV